MMPGLDGLQTTLKIREQQRSFPIIMLSAKSEDTDKIAGLGFGADDYVTKPFSPLELVARIKSQIRRYISFAGFVQKKTQLVTGGLVVDTDAKTVSVDGEPIKLTAREYMILEYLCKIWGAYSPPPRSMRLCGTSLHTNPKKQLPCISKHKG